MSKSTTTAFTLIELLVVIAIIAVLAGLVLSIVGPVNTVRNQADSASRLRQWAAALAGYVADNNGLLPRRGQGMKPVTDFGRLTDWFNALPPYAGLPGYGQLVSNGQRPKAGDKSIFIRPGATDPGGTAFLGYGMNMNLSPWNLANATMLAQVTQPSLVVFLAEGTGQYSSTYPSTQPYSCQAPYRGQGNILFLDGHVGAFSATYLGVGQGDPQRDDIHWLTGTASDSMASKY